MGHGGTTEYKGITYPRPCILSYHDRENISKFGSKSGYD